MVVQSLSIVPRLLYRPVSTDIDQGWEADSCDISQLFNADIPLTVRSLLYNLQNLNEATSPSKLDTISIVYKAFVSEFSDEIREQVFLHVVEQIRTNDLDPIVIQAFIQNEPNHFLARNAVSIYLQIKVVTDTDPFDATRNVISILKSKDVANKGAVFAGLICFGDRHVCAVARTLQDSITPAEMRAFAVSVSSPLHRASIEFCLTWLSDLVANKNFEMAIPVASALSSMVIKDSTLVVHDFEHNFGPYGFSSANAAPVIAYTELLGELSPILDSITLVDHAMLSQMVEIIREPSSSTLDQLERRESNTRRKHMEQRASDRRIVDLRPRMERRALQRRGTERRVGSRR